jgi:hypothetical protein
MTLMQEIFVPNDLRDLHDVWLAGLAAKAEAAVRGTTTSTVTAVEAKARAGE